MNKPYTPLSRAEHNNERNHLHCPLFHEHPQPFCVGELILCGLCFYFDNKITAMVECSREYCE